MVSSREQSPGAHNAIGKKRGGGNIVVVNNNNHNHNNRSGISTPSTPPLNPRRETFTGSSTFGAG